MYLDHEISEYFTFNAKEKDYIQRFLFLQYLEEWEVSRFKGVHEYTLHDTILTDKLLHLNHESYETCQLYEDVLQRFKYELKEYE